MHLVKGLENKSTHERYLGVLDDLLEAHPMFIKNLTNNEKQYVKEHREGFTRYLTIRMTFFLYEIAINDLFLENMKNTKDLDDMKNNLRKEIKTVKELIHNYHERFGDVRFNRVYKLFRSNYSDGDLYVRTLKTFLLETDHTSLGNKIFTNNVLLTRSSTDTNTVLGETWCLRAGNVPNFNDNKFFTVRNYCRLMIQIVDKPW